MCFSATASFISGGVLSAAGVVTLLKVTKKTEIPFASIPLLFGIQQIIEGIIWLTFRYSAPELNEVMTMVYSIFSHVIWPIYVPLSIVLLETIPWRKNVISAFLGLGTIVSFYLLYFLITLPVTSQVMNKHLVYVSPHFNLYIAMSFYVAAVSISTLFSSHKLVNIFGVLLLFSFGATFILSKMALISVWCFFAALLSIIIFVFINNQNLFNSWLALKYKKIN
jgi:hypothetical protein